MKIHFGARITTRLYNGSSGDSSKKLDQQLKEKNPDYQGSSQLNIGTDSNPILLSVDTESGDLVVLNNRPKHEDAGNFLDMQAAINHLQNERLITSEQSAKMMRDTSAQAQQGCLFEEKNPYT